MRQTTCLPEAEETETVTRFPLIARLWAVILVAALVPAGSWAAPFAAYVIDARTGQPIYKQNESTRLHPASLTKMMTLYMAFTAVERGQVRLDSKFKISSNAAAEPPSKLGLKAGQSIELRYLLRAAAIKSANDAATAIGEGLAGSEDAFAQQMTQMARALGMRNTNFRNANGLTQEGHYSTAYDMTILGRHLFYDFPQYYNLFSRRSADAGIAQVSSTNKRFLDAYKGADGIKTGYTRAAGFNLTASAQRGNKRLIATVFGGTSTAQRNQVMSQLLDSSFARVPERVRETRPKPPRLIAQKTVRRAQVEPKPVVAQPQALTLNASAPPERAAPARSASTAAIASPMQIAEAVRAAAASSSTPGRMSLTSSARPRLRPGTPATDVAAAVEMAVSEGQGSASLVAPVLSTSTRPIPAPRSRSARTSDASTAVIAPALPEPTPTERALTGQMSLLASSVPEPRTDTVILAAMGEGDISEPAALEIVSRPQNSGRNWGVTLGLYRSKVEADRLLLQTALQGGAALEGANRHVADTVRGFEANFVNLTKADARLACERLQTRQQECRVVGP
ncbi:D-alanyl-D-alanine carboxypeptidase [Paracoccus homiensis]|uniref:D-alanyl-D-alanine carboxypeptidase n=1 Tax=Paracoccus homiensis TaxID=364199 RepID=A0A1I0FHN7_9RHOB|nr:D-alanyl-D-alanine carboxypeptidase family protein [Paracoccus homiensis]SET56724.1 D-alanyl-D-alanine carboxypeptidase [Paracoccus homiensis]